MKYWYDIVKDEYGNEKMFLMPDNGHPAPKDFDDVYPVPWGVQGYVYFSTKLGAIMVNSDIGTLEGCAVYVTIK